MRSSTVGGGAGGGGGGFGGPPATLGMMCYWSTHAAVVQVERIDKEKNVIIFRKLRDIKGRWPTDVIRHNIGKGPGVPQHIMQWAEPGKRTVTFALESYKWSHTYVDGLWYAASTADWQGWNLSHAEPTLLRGFSGKTERLVSATSSILAGKEVVVASAEPGVPLHLMVSGLTKDNLAKVKDSLTALSLQTFVCKSCKVEQASAGFVFVAGAATTIVATLPTAALRSADGTGHGAPNFSTHVQMSWYAEPRHGMSVVCSMPYSFARYLWT